MTALTTLDVVILVLPALLASLAAVLVVARLRRRAVRRAQARAALRRTLPLDDDPEALARAVGILRDRQRDDR